MEYLSLYNRYKTYNSLELRQQTKLKTLALILTQNYYESSTLTNLVSISALVCDVTNIANKQPTDSKQATYRQQTLLTIDALFESHLTTELGEHGDIPHTSKKMSKDAYLPSKVQHPRTYDQRSLQFSQ